MINVFNAHFMGGYIMVKQDYALVYIFLYKDYDGKTQNIKTV